MYRAVHEKYGYVCNYLIRCIGQKIVLWKGSKQMYMTRFIHSLFKYKSCINYVFICAEYKYFCLKIEVK